MHKEKRHEPEKLTDWMGHFEPIGALFSCEAPPVRTSAGCSWMNLAKEKFSCMRLDINVTHSHTLSFISIQSKWKLIGVTQFDGVWLPLEELGLIFNDLASWKWYKNSNTLFYVALLWCAEINQTTFPPELTKTIPVFVLVFRRLDRVSSAPSPPSSSSFSSPQRLRERLSRN